MKRLIALIFILSLAPASAQRQGQVVMNGSVVGQQVLNVVAQQYNFRIPPGRYWYDKYSGAWGYEGGGTQGFIAAGFPYYAAMPAQISGGNTGTYINGRHLPYSDVQALRRVLGTVYKGKFWLDAQGNAGYIGGPAIVNIRQAASNGGYYRQGSGVGQVYRNGGGSYRNSNTGIGVITDGQGGAGVFTR
jgi:hypothetical protein